MPADLQLYVGSFIDQAVEADNVSIPIREVLKLVVPHPSAAVAVVSTWAYLIGFLRIKANPDPV